MVEHDKKAGKGKRILKRTGVTLLVLVITWIAWHFWANLDVTVNVPQLPPAPSPNAYDYYLKAAIAASKISQVHVQRAQGNVPGLPDYSPAEKTAILAAGASVERILHEGFAYPCQDPLLRIPVPSRLLQDYSCYQDYAAFRGLARYLSFVRRVKAERGDWDGAMTVSLDSLRFSHDISQRSALTGLLFGIAIESSLSRVNTWKMLHHLNSKQARAATGRLEDILAREPVLADALLEEKYLGQLDLHELFTRSNWRDELYGRFTARHLFQIRDIDDIRQMRIRVASKRDIMSGYTRYMDAIIARAKLSFAQSSALPPIDYRTLVAAPQFDRVQHKYLVNNTQNALLLVSLALQAHHAEHGAYPATLAALTPAYLKKLPDDPFAASGPLQYRRQGNAYTLYSLGPDGSNDYGRPIIDKTRSNSLRYQVFGYGEQIIPGDIVAGINNY